MRFEVQSYPRVVDDGEGNEALHAPAASYSQDYGPQRRKGWRRRVGPRMANVQTAFKHDGEVVHAGDIVESDKDLAAAFPDRFKRIE